MLTGDLYHFEEQVPNEGVPTFNTDRADTLASFHRFNQIAENLDATVIIQHDPRHVTRLPAFPKGCKIMDPVSSVEGKAIPFGAKNVDTDVIIPAHGSKPSAAKGWAKALLKQCVRRRAMFSTTRNTPARQS